MDPLVDKKAKYESLIQDAAKAYLDKHYHKASILYYDAFTLASELGMGKMMICILKYMMCHCLLENDKSTNKLEDLTEVVMNLQTLEKSLKDRFPSVYCLLAQAHCKLFRFDQALDAINSADAIYKRNSLMETLYIPGTNIAISQHKNDGAWLKVREECSAWHKPDAICSLSDCNNITKPYVTPNRNIFIRDPAFNGIVIVNCNNKTRSCTLKFHPYCWKFKKDQLYPVEKVSDKDMIGSICFTPNCVNGTTPCTISSIEIIGQEGELKAHIKEPTSVHWSGNKNAAKGAIKKVKMHTSKKSESPTRTPQTPSKQHNAVVPKQAPRTIKRPHQFDEFDENQIISITDSTEHVNFSSDPEDVANKKTFLLSIFLSYVGESSNLVTVGEIYSKFFEITEDTNIGSLKNINILTFLLETKKFEVLNKDILTPQYIEQENVDNNISDNDSNEDLTDVYYELTKDDVEQTEFSEKNGMGKNSKFNGAMETCDMQSNDKAAGGDAPSCIGAVKSTKNSGYEPEKRTSENKNLKEYIRKLENEMKILMDKNDILNKELRKKDSEIESLKKEQEEKVEQVESVFQKMTDFKQRYDKIKEENIKLKEEIIGLIKEKKKPELKRIELVKSFQEEYQILTECINKEWEEKTKKLKKSLHSETETLALKLIHKCLDYQKLSNKNFLDRYINYFVVAVEVIDNINSWIGKTIGMKNFVDDSEWLLKLKSLQKVCEDNESEYLQYVDQLKTESTDILAMVDIEISKPEVPDLPSRTLNDIVVNALTILYDSQCEITRNLVKQQQQLQQQLQTLQQQQQQQHQRSMMYQMPGAPPGYSQYAAQFSYGSNFRPMLNCPIPQVNAMQLPVIQPMIPTVSSANDLASNWKPQTNVLNKIIESNHDSTHNITPKVEIVEVPCQMITKRPIKEITDDVKSRVDEVQERLSLMQEALKGICLSAQEKKPIKNSPSHNDSDDNEYCNQSDATTVKQKTDNGLTVKNENDSQKSESTISNSQSSDNTVVAVTKEQPKRKQIGTEALLKLLLKKYPGTLELDLIEIISDIRKKHNNTLTGIPVSQILKESEELFSQSQRIHMLRYYVNDGSKSSYSETPVKAFGLNQQSVFREAVSPASSTSSLNKRSIPSTPKKTWNTMPQEETKWIGSDEAECSICMGRVNKSSCYTLSCRHTFHVLCVKRWLKSDRSCPNCRVIVTEDDEFPPLPA